MVDLRPGKKANRWRASRSSKSTYGEPISDVKASVTHEKRFEVSVEPDSPADTVRVRVAVRPTEKMMKPSIQATLKISAKVGDNDVDEKMTVVYRTDENMPGDGKEGHDSETEDAGASTGKH